MNSSLPIITLTTDFGLADAYVGVMKAVVLGIAPGVRIVDLSHDVAAQDVMGAALVLEAAGPYFPVGTIHVAVVDPGVGTPRAAVAIQTQRAVYVGPDNGVFTAVLARDPAVRAVALTNDQYHRRPVSATFHGRDIFAPVAAHLAAGVPLDALGPPHPTLVRLDLPQPKVGDDGSLSLTIIAVDRFGNLTTNLAMDHYQRWLGDGAAGDVRIELGATSIAGMATTFADVPVGQPVAYFASGGRLEIAVRQGNAAAALGARRGSTVVVRR